MKSKTIAKALSSSPMHIVSVILAAGKGTRMKSALPKVLHKVAGISMLEHVMKAVRELGSSRMIVVLNPDTQNFREVCSASPDIGYAIQMEQKGTADAVAAAAVLLEGEKLPPYCRAEKFSGKPISKNLATHILICTGDVPCLSGKVLTDFSQKFADSGAIFGVLGVQVPDPTGYGRLILGRGKNLHEIVEERDATAAQRKISLINSGIIIAERQALFEILKLVKPQNNQGEYYLTSLFSIARKKRLKSYVYTATCWREFEGINDRAQLAAAEEFILDRKRRELQLGGVSLCMPKSIYVDVNVQAGVDTLVEPGVVLQGVTILGDKCHVGSHSTLVDCKVSNGVVIGAGSYLKNCRLNPGEVLAPGTQRLK